MAPASEPALAADRTGSLPFGNQARTCSIHVPDGPPPRGGFPVVLAFHGRGHAWPDGRNTRDHA